MITPEDIQQIRTIIREEIEKLRKDPTLPWRHIDYIYDSVSANFPNNSLNEGQWTVWDNPAGTGKLGFYSRGKHFTITVASED